MIGKALQFTQSILDQFLRNRFGLDESIVILNNIVDSTGSPPSENQNKVVLSLINIEKETLKPFYNKNQRHSNGLFADSNPSERYNLDLLVSANFEDYHETLKFLGASMLFFQVNPCLDSGSSGEIPAGTNKLEFDIEKLTYHQMHSLWTAMGAKYQPSVIYKMRLITLQGNEPEGYSTSVTSVSANMVHT
ncbi:MAG TPA: DUF4255 domain-containing protein [Flavobacteriales bacterium]|nr:DUF4255 domain-containing protein [Flavobacteriales bacterium]